MSGRFGLILGAPISAGCKYTAFGCWQRLAQAQALYQARLKLHGQLLVMLSVIHT